MAVTALAKWLESLAARRWREYTGYWMHSSHFSYLHRL